MVSFYAFTGSIVVTFRIAGTNSSVNATTYSLCDNIYSEKPFTYNGHTLTLEPYLTVNNQTYYGVTCGETVWKGRLLLLFHSYDDNSGRIAFFSHNSSLRVVFEQEQRGGEENHKLIYNSNV